MNRQAYPVRTDIGSGHDAGDEGIGMCVPRLQINVQHVKRKTAFFTGNVQCELDDDPGILSARKRNIDLIKFVE